MPEPVQPLQWTPHPPLLRAIHNPAPLTYTAPGGWIILNDPQPGTPDRPWKLCRHGVEVERAHTLRLAKRYADMMTAAQESAR